MRCENVTFDVNRFEEWVGFATQPDPLKFIHVMSMQFNRFNTYIYTLSGSENSLHIIFATHEWMTRQCPFPKKLYECSW